MQKQFNRLAWVVGIVSLVVAGWNTSLNADTIAWNVGGSGTWDILTSTNWTADAGGRNDNKYANGDAVSFTDTAGGVITLATNVAPASTTVNATSGTYTFTGANITNGLLTKSGGSTLILNSQLTSGTMDVTAGTLQWGASERLPDNVVNASYSGGTLDMQNYFETLGGLKGSHNIINFGGMRLTVGGDRSGGNISGSGALTFDLPTPGTLHYFQGTSNYTGGTNIDNGTIYLYGNNAFPMTGVLNVNAPGTFTVGYINGGLTQTIGALNGNGSVIASVNNVNLSPFVIGNGGGSGTFDGIYSGFGSLTKLGAGTQVMNGNNTYTGPTTISGGKLIVNGVTGSGQDNYTVQSGATLGGDGTINLAAAKAVSVLAGGILEPGDTVGTMTINGGLNLNDGAILNMDLNTGGDTIVVNGQVTGSASAGGITLNLNPQVDFGDFVLLDWTGGSASGLDLTDFNVVGGEGGTLSIVGSQLLFSIPAPPIPEPTSLALLSLGLLGLVRKGRRQRNAAIALV